MQQMRNSGPSRQEILQQVRYSTRCVGPGRSRLNPTRDGWSPQRSRGPGATRSCHTGPKARILDLVGRRSDIGLRVSLPKTG